ncbi:hypothetical protein IFM89_002312 [Coptis chinensis]|uniref:Uncharacterized protein n=1 Tax=Coptis chinensis TaxID=261450 RepID=A0A835ILT9_9MAGN|nr:hypothetical protein IFM89_002312 [Coptis chinensis]
MSLLAWNSRGSGRPSMMEELKKQIKDVRPIFSFVMETKCSVNKGVSLIKRLGNFESFVVPSQGLSGGLWIFWDKSVVVEVLMSDSWFIQSENIKIVNGVHEGWRSRFSGCRVHHVLATSSDHKFLILKLLQDRVTVRRPFRFEIMWVQHDGCQEQIRDAFHNEVRESKSLGRKACLDWFQFGEQNTRFYHNMVNCRWQRNYIHSIRDRNGGILTERRQIGERLSEFFEDTMTTSDPDLMSQIFNVHAPSLEEDEKSNLLKGVTIAEIVNRSF